jgi:NAD(P)-dependent dehydrogenase (short-subunit alcohol dehydrogenase family)
MKTYLITGGTSGLGRALALRALELGARVAVVARRPRELEEFRRYGERFVFIEGDLSRKEAIHRIAGEVQARLGPVDVLVNNASQLGPVPLRPLLDLECEELSDVFETNLFGPFRLTKALLPSMVLRGEGAVVNISSDAAIESYPTWGAYSASKAALDHLTRIWAVELGDSGVKFFAFDPGEMDTPMHAAAIPDADPKTLRRPSDVASRILQEIENYWADQSPENTPVRRSI